MPDPITPVTPPVTPPADPPTDPPATPPNPTLYAGKYTSPEALEKATRDLSGKLEIMVAPEGTPLYGKGTPFTDVMQHCADELGRNHHSILAHL